MVDQDHQREHLQSRQRCGSLTSERTLLDILEGQHHQLKLTSLKLGPINSNLYARRHSSHVCPITEICHGTSVVPPPLPLRPPAVPKRNFVPDLNNQLVSKNAIQILSSRPPPIPPSSKNRTVPTKPVSTFKPQPPARNRKCVTIDLCNTMKSNDANKNAYGKQIPPPSNRLDCVNSTTYNHHLTKLPPNSPSTNPFHTSSSKTGHKTYTNKSIINQQPHQGKMSLRQDSSISSDSFSQTSSPSYTSKTMEMPLLSPYTPIKKQNSILAKMQSAISEAEVDANNQAITKSSSTPASLQTIVKFHNGSNMSLHHRIIKDIRRPSDHFDHHGLRLKFRFAQVVLNAIALFAIGAGMAAYFKAYPTELNKNNHPSNNTTDSAVSNNELNPAPGVCLPVIVSFCKLHKVPYNFTVFPNYMGQFGQRGAQQELEVYDAVVDVRCYELAALFLCSLFVPKCGPTGVVVRPCRSICYETKRRCGFFLDVFGLALPEYLDCSLFPESTDPNTCVGHQEVKEAKIRAQKPVCPNGFQCDVKRCIPKDWQCDGHMDCKDQTDELNCSKCGIGMVNCGANKCITQEHVCDGQVDCPWAQDERNCLRLSNRNGDEGKGQLEIYRPDQEKWVPACVAHWDNKYSAKSICSLLGYLNSNSSRLLSGIHSKMSPPIKETTAIWRMNQNKKPKNLIREFGSCNGTDYPTVELVCTDYVCGKARKSYAERRTPRIVGGVKSKPGDWPFLAALLGGPEEVFYCAGVLIADQWVLTASHCVGNHSDVSGWTIQLGITRRNAHSFYGQKMKVKRVVPHPMYNLGIAHDNDVALFQLTSRVAFHEHLLPVCLPSPEKKLEPGTICTVIGWGKKEDTGTSEYEPEVNEVQVPILKRELCNAWLEHRDLNVTSGMICAGYKEGGKDACQGDSGGPLLCRDDGDTSRWFVGGIVSWGIKCAHPHLPGVYAYVPKYIPWIIQQINFFSD